MKFCYQGVREAAKKVHPLVAGPLRERGGCKGRAIKEKITFLKFYFGQLIEILTYHVKVYRQVFYVGLF